MEKVALGYLAAADSRENNFCIFHENNRTPLF